MLVITLCDLILGSVKFLKTFSNKDALQGVNTATDTSGHVRVRMCGVVLLEPIQVRVRNVNRFWHTYFPRTGMCGDCITRYTSWQHLWVSKVLTFQPRRVKSA